jgi:hypothetical protein
MRSVVKYRWFTTIAPFTARMPIPMAMSDASRPPAAKKRTSSPASGKSVYAGQRSPGSGRTDVTIEA